MASLKNKVVLITGASSGIGAATAIHLASLGCRLALNGRNEDNLKAVVEKCTATGLPKENALPIVAPLDEEEDCKRIIDETINRFGRLDVLVNNAGVGILGPVETLPVKEFDKQMQINVRSVFVLTQLAIPHLVKVKGNIVNVSSIAGTRAFPGATAYCMSKAALDQFTSCLALELADRGVRVNVVNPGLILTEFHRRAGMSEERYAQHLERAKQVHPLGRPGNADEVAKVIAFLASDDASFVTGEKVAVDGGRQAACPI